MPTHKKGDKSDVNNYRGISISSCLSKLFTSILNKRLYNYMKDNSLWRRNQCGFMSGHNAKQKVYMAFVDFSKYFDSINRDFLYYKLLKHGISGNFYHLIKSMYILLTLPIFCEDQRRPIRSLPINNRSQTGL